MVSRSQFEATKGERWKDNIQGITQDSDIVIGNLESPLLEPSLAAGKPGFLRQSEFACFLERMRYRSAQCGKQSYTGAWEGGYERTLQILKSPALQLRGTIIVYYIFIGIIA